MGTEINGGKMIHPRPPSRSVTRSVTEASPGVLTLACSSLSSTKPVSRGEGNFTRGFALPEDNLQIIHA